MRASLNFELPDTLHLLLKAAADQAEPSEIAALLRAAEVHFRILFEQHEYATQFTKPDVQETDRSCKDALQVIVYFVRDITGLNYPTKEERQQAAAKKNLFIETYLDPSYKRAILHYAALTLQNAVWLACIRQVLRGEKTHERQT